VTGTQIIQVGLGGTAKVMLPTITLDLAVKLTKVPAGGLR
jgi:hypothetical protein